MSVHTTNVVYVEGRELSDIELAMFDALEQYEQDKTDTSKMSYHEYQEFLKQERFQRRKFLDDQHEEHKQKEFARERQYSEFEKHKQEKFDRQREHQNKTGGITNYWSYVNGRC